LAGNPRQAFAKNGLDDFAAGCERLNYKPMKKLALLAIPAAFALAFTTNALAADGKAVYADSCAKCHGDDGKGQTKMGQKVGARDYTDAAVQASFSDADGIKAVKEGLKKDDKTLMKPFQLSDDDIKAVIAYMRTFKK
jgi:mono/diheme cytochrome c family protein